MRLLRTTLRTGAVAAALVLVGSAGCKDATVGPDLRGDIAGAVLDFETGEPVPEASVTTSPPSEALLTDAEGRFSIEDLEEGTYQVTVRKAGYATGSVTVAARDGRLSSATVLLEADAEDDPEQPPLAVEVVSFWNHRRGDSTFVATEYRVRNPESAAVSAYEVYFRIDTPADTLFHDEEGGALASGQIDTRRFELYLPADTAVLVEVDGVWSDGEADGSAPAGSGER